MIVIISAWISRLVMALCSVISIRLLTDALGVDAFAAYSLLIGLLPWFMLLDFGSGPVLQNHVASRRAKGKQYEPIVGQITRLSLVTLVILILLFWATSNQLGEQYLSNASFLSDDSRADIFFVFAVLATTTAIGSLVYKLWFGEERGYLSNIFPAVAALSSLVMLYFYGLDSQEKHGLLLATIIMNAPAAIIPLFYLIKRGLSAHRKMSSSPMHKEYADDFKQHAPRFLLFNLLAVGVNAFDYIVLAMFIDASEVVTYVITLKCFQLLAVFLGAVMQAFWPKSTMWITHGQFQKVKSGLHKYMIFVILLVPTVTLSFALLSEFVIDLLAPNTNLKIPTEFIAVVGISYLIRLLTDPYAVILQSVNKIEVLLKFAAVQAALNFGLQILLAQWLGIYGIILGISLSYLLTVTWALPIQVYRLLRA